MINDFKSSINLNKIKSISAVVRVLAVIGLILFIATEFFGGLSLELSYKVDTAFDNQNAKTDWVTTSEYDNIQRHLTEILARLPFQFSVIGAFYWLFQLFGCFRKGDIFTDASVKSFRFLAVCVILIGVNSLLYGGYKGVLDMIISRGEIVHFNIEMNGTHFLMIGFGLLLYAMALVQREAKMRTDDLKLIF